MGVETVKKVLRPHKAEIIVAGKKIYIGAYATKEEARVAYERKKAEVEADKKDRERQQELETPGHGPGKIPLRNKEGVIVNWAIVDLEDEAAVRAHRWYLEKVSDQLSYAGGNNTRLHIFILGGAANGGVIDHIDNDGLNNRRSNLRKVTTSINAMNTKRVAGETGYRGVRKLGSRYYCRVRNLFNIGFSNALDAAQQYDRIMLKLYGPIAKTNNTLSETEVQQILEIYRSSGPEFFEIRKEDEDQYILYKTNFLYTTFEAALTAFQESKKDHEFQVYQSNMQKRQKSVRSEIAYNDSGDAVIELRNKSGSVVSLALVDDEIWHEASRHGWYLDQNGYVAAMTDLGRVRLHNYVWKKLKGDIPSNRIVDHIQNGESNRTNCKLSNLRLNTYGGNSHNCSTKSISGYRGVQRAKSGKVKAKIQYQSKQIYLGTFATMEEAARAYDKEAVKLYGDGACLNFT